MSLQTIQCDNVLIPAKISDVVVEPSLAFPQTDQSDTELASLAFTSQQQKTPSEVLTELTNEAVEQTFIQEVDEAEDVPERVYEKINAAETDSPAEKHGEDLTSQVIKPIPSTVPLEEVVTLQDEKTSHVLPKPSERDQTNAEANLTPSSVDVTTPRDDYDVVSEMDEETALCTGSELIELQTDETNVGIAGTPQMTEVVSVDEPFQQSVDLPGSQEEKPLHSEIDVNQGQLDLESLATSAITECLEENIVQTQGFKEEIICEAAPTEMKVDADKPISSTIETSTVISGEGNEIFETECLPVTEKLNAEPTHETVSTDDIESGRTPALTAPTVVGPDISGVKEVHKVAVDSSAIQELEIQLTEADTPVVLQSEVSLGEEVLSTEGLDVLPCVDDESPMPELTGIPVQSAEDSSVPSLTASIVKDEQPLSCESILQATEDAAKVHEVQVDLGQKEDTTVHSAAGLATTDQSLTEVTDISAVNVAESGEEITETVKEHSSDTANPTEAALIIDEENISAVEKVSPTPDLSISPEDAHIMTEEPLSSRLPVETPVSELDLPAGHPQEIPMENVAKPKTDETDVPSDKIQGVQTLTEAIASIESETENDVHTSPEIQFSSPEIDNVCIAQLTVEAKTSPSESSIAFTETNEMDTNKFSATDIYTPDIAKQTIQLDNTSEDLQPTSVLDDKTIQELGTTTAQVDTPVEQPVAEKTELFDEFTGRADVPSMTSMSEQSVDIENVTSIDNSGMTNTSLSDVQIDTEDISSTVMDSHVPLAQVDVEGQSIADVDAIEFDSTVPTADDTMACSPYTDQKETSVQDSSLDMKMENVTETLPIDTLNTSSSVSALVPAEPEEKQLDTSVSEIIHVVEEDQTGSLNSVEYSSARMESAKSELEQEEIATIPNQTQECEVLTESLTSNDKVATDTQTATVADTNIETEKGLPTLAETGTNAVIEDTNSKTADTVLPVPQTDIQAEEVCDDVDGGETIVTASQAVPVEKSEETVGTENITETHVIKASTTDFVAPLEEKAMDIVAFTTPENSGIIDGKQSTELPETIVSHPEKTINEDLLQEGVAEFVQTEVTSSLKDVETSHEPKEFFSEDSADAEGEIVSVSTDYPSSVEILPQIEESVEKTATEEAIEQQPIDSSELAPEMIKRVNEVKVTDNQVQNVVPLEEFVEDGDALPIEQISESHTQASTSEAVAIDTPGVMSEPTNVEETTCEIGITEALPISDVDSTESVQPLEITNLENVVTAEGADVQLTTQVKGIPDKVNDRLWLIFSLDLARSLFQGF